MQHHDAPRQAKAVGRKERGQFSGNVELFGSEKHTCFSSHAFISS